VKLAVRVMLSISFSVAATHQLIRWYPVDNPTLRACTLNASSMTFFYCLLKDWSRWVREDRHFVGSIEDVYGMRCAAVCRYQNLIYREPAHGDIGQTEASRNVLSHLWHCIRDWLADG
jgi:hypothetical protein